MATEAPVPGTYKVRICDVFSVPWRKTDQTEIRDPGSFDHTEGFREFATSQLDLPQTLEQRLFHDDAALSIMDEPMASFGRIEVVLFALPIPVSQVVAALVLDFHEDEFRSDQENRVRRLMTA